MANKIIDISNAPVDNVYSMLSQTPGNYEQRNFFLKTYQDKVNADWEYAYNRVAVEYEVGWNTPKYWKKKEYPILGYAPIEVRINTVKNDKGQAIAEDVRRLIFKNIREDRFKIGQKFKFAEDYKLSAPEMFKNTWLVTNRNPVSPSSSVIITRCNSTLGSLYTDEQGVSHYHYEPVILTKDLSSTNFIYNEVAVAPQSGLTIICQHNRYTKEYQVNQRFIIGYDTVYRIKGINKFYGNSTQNPYDVGLMQLYLEVTQASAYDDFENRIAYEQEPHIILSNDEQHKDLFFIEFIKPTDIPTSLFSNEIEFEPILRDDHENEYNDVRIYVDCTLENWPAGKEFDMDDNPYFSIRYEGNTFYLSRKRLYLNGELVVKCYVSAEFSPTQEEISTSFKLVMKDFE